MKEVILNKKDKFADKEFMATDELGHNYLIKFNEGEIKKVKIEGSIVYTIGLISCWAIDLVGGEIILRDITGLNKRKNAKVLDKFRYFELDEKEKKKYEALKTLNKLEEEK
jgi:hypothetical protein